MAASTNDLVTNTRNAARPNSARVTSGRATGGATLACDNLAGWPTASKVHFVTYTVDTNSNPVAGSQLDCSGIVSGNNIGSLVVIDGSDTGNAINDYVEMLPTSAWGQDLADALTNQHSRTGAHVGITNTGGMTTDTLTVTGASTHTGVATFTAVPLLPNDTVETADVQADAVTDAKLVYGKLRSRQGGSATNWQTVGTTTYDYSATNTFIQAGSVSASSSGAATITFPTAFNQIPLVFASVNSAASQNVFVRVTSQSATQCIVTIITDGGSLGTGEVVNWMAIGE